MCVGSFHVPLRGAPTQEHRQQCRLSVPAVLPPRKTESNYKYSSHGMKIGHLIFNKQRFAYHVKNKRLLRVSIFTPELPEIWNDSLFNTVFI